MWGWLFWCQQSGGQRHGSSDDYGETIDFKRNLLGGNVSFPTWTTGVSAVLKN